MNLTYDTEKLPRDYQRPGVFISIGPSGFTAAGLGKSDTRAYIFTFLRSTTEAFALRSSMGCVENTHIEVRIVQWYKCMFHNVNRCLQQG